MNTKRISILLLILAASLALSACLGAPKSTPVEGADREKVLAFSEPITDNVFKGLEARDYAVFSRDFDETMKKAVDEKAFNNLTGTLESKIGKYESRQIQSVQRFSNNVITVVYAAKFSGEDAVTTRVSFREGPPPQVAGLFFTSPKLTGK